MSLTLLPAILAALGPRVNALARAARRCTARRPMRGGFWYRLSQAVMRRPVPIAAGARRC